MDVPAPGRCSGEEAGKAAGKRSDGDGPRRRKTADGDELRQVCQPQQGDRESVPEGRRVRGSEGYLARYLPLRFKDWRIKCFQKELDYEDYGCRRCRIHWFTAGSVPVGTRVRS